MNANARPFLAVAVLAFAVLCPASSEAAWTKAETFEHSASTSLKITEPTDAKVFVTIGSETKEATLPAIFPLPDADAYVQVKIVGADGDAWTGKIEVKAKKQTVVKFAHAGAPTAAAAPAGKMIGQIQNWTGKCSSLKDRQTLKFVAMKDGASAYETTLKPNQAQSNVELPPGKYSIRLFKDGVFVQAKEFVVEKDGWIFAWAPCQ